MAMKRCPDCGEKYSDSYKYCPFCEEEEILKEGKGRGSRRARQSKGFSVLTPVLIVLIIVMAGLLMFLLKSDKQPTEPVTPQPGVETPDNTANPGSTEEPDHTTDPGVIPDEPDTEPVDPDTNTNNSNTNTNTSTNTGTAGGEATVVNAETGVNVRPDASTSGAAIASLKNGDKVKVVRDAGNGWYEITFSGPGGRDTSGYVKGDFLSTTAGSSTTTTTTTSSTTTNTTISGSGTSAPGGSLKTGSAKVTNAAGGVNVRPGPSASGTPVASLKNGDEVQVIKSAGDGWYEITFTGPGGKDTSGYMKGDYLTNS